MLNHVQKYIATGRLDKVLVEVQTRSLAGHFPKPAFALWEVRINNCIFFSNFSLIVLIMTRPTP